MKERKSRKDALSQSQKKNITIEKTYSTGISAIYMEGANKRRKDDESK